MPAMLDTSYTLPPGYAIGFGRLNGVPLQQRFIVQTATNRAIPVTLVLLAGDEPEDFDAYFLSHYEPAE